MTKKRSTKKSVRKSVTTLNELEHIRGYHLWLRRVKQMDTQLSFADLLDDLPATSDPIIAMQHERMLAEIDELNCRTGISIIDRGAYHHRSRGTALVIVDNDEAGILLAQSYAGKKTQRQLQEIMKIVLTIEDVLGFKTYDPQLGRDIDIRRDIPEIEAAWAGLVIED